MFRFDRTRYGPFTFVSSGWLHDASRDAERVEAAGAAALTVVRPLDRGLSSHLHDREEQNSGVNEKEGELQSGEPAGKDNQTR